MSAYGKMIMISESGSSARLKRRSLQGEGHAKVSERQVQELIHRHPECLPIEEIEPGFGRAVSVCMELPTAHGYADNLLISPTGNIALVEAKLWRNPQARREAVAQALDYASTLFEMSYTDLEDAVLKAEFNGAAAPASLYDVLDQADALPESEFVDAVTMNLRRGRILVLVVGDGIRSEAEELVAGLQSHAGFHFTFGLVEIALYALVDSNDIIAQPRVLAQTCMIERAVVRIDDDRVRIETPAAPKRTSVTSRNTITSEQFMEAMENLQAGLAGRIARFVESLEPLGVTPEYRASLILRFVLPSGNRMNLGYIMKTGEIWTNLVHPDEVPHEISNQYVADIATAFDCEINKTRYAPVWCAMMGKSAPYIQNVTDSLDAWAEAIAKYLKEISSRADECE